MKRSQVNAALKWAKELLEQNKFKLPSFGYWSMQDWRANSAKSARIKELMLGWDITDYGMKNFMEVGSVLFTIRNGKLGDASVGTPYAEKLIMIYDGQRLPLHYHASKTEDIINRGGGVMFITLYNAKRDGSVDYEYDVRVFVDSIEHIMKAGETLEVMPGSSISLTPFLYHIFGAKKRCGDVLVGEVSSINDDNKDNFFAEEVSRFSTIEEDEPILHPLCNEYTQVL